MPKPSPQLIFVYNAQRGAAHKVLDFLHKSISPATYQCDLCALTYGHFSMKKEWKSFIESLPLSARFFYREDLQEYLPASDYALPCVLLVKQNTPTLLISAEEMKRMGLAQLKTALKERVENELRRAG
jgi:hypothetical protein